MRVAGGMCRDGRTVASAEKQSIQVSGTEAVSFAFAPAKKSLQPQPRNMASAPLLPVFFGFHIPAVHLASAAGKGFEPYRPALLAVDLISRRRAVGTLSTRNAGTESVAQVPAEVWQMIRDILLDEAVSEVRKAVHEKAVYREYVPRRVARAGYSSLTICGVAESSQSTSVRRSRRKRERSGGSWCDGGTRLASMTTTTSSSSRPMRTTASSGPT